MSKYEIRKDLESKNDKIKYIGRLFNSKSTGKFIVLGVHHKDKHCVKHYVIEFVNTRHRTIATSSAINSGSIKDFLVPSVHGVGYIGDHNERVSSCFEYKIWSYMIGRCYSKTCIRRAYANVEVCERWLNFSNFVEDIKTILGFDEMILHPNVKFDIEKDIFSSDKKIYSLNNCCFVPEKINNFFVNEQITNKSNYVGVHFAKDKMKYVAYVFKNNKRIHIGQYDCPIKAQIEYFRVKMDILDEYLTFDFNWLDKIIKKGCYDKLKKQKSQYLLISK